MKNIILYYKNNGLKKTLHRIIIHIYFKLKINLICEHICTNKDDNMLWKEILFEKKELTVSIIVPNYNHALYLRERLESIYNQTYRNFEVILLDDCSTDKSREILEEYKRHYPDNTTLLFNMENTGCPFEQWLLGMDVAKGDLIWLAESDDWCDLDFLEKMLPAFNDEAVMLAYCNIIFIEDGKKVWDLQSYLYDFGIDFNSPFKMSANDFVKKVMFCKNPIANASSALFRNQKYINSDISYKIKNLTLCGDWLFYLYIIQGGIVSYMPYTNDYYRVHKKSTSIKMQKMLEYYNEQFCILKYISSKYKINENHIRIKYQDIILEYKYKYKNDISLLVKIYEQEDLFKKLQSKKINIGICGFAFTVGGGEIFPIHLANALKLLGYSVTYFDFNFCKRIKNIRNLLSPNIPVVVSPHIHGFQKIVEQLNIDILHTHHGCVDSLVFELSMYKKCYHVVTLHGFYEAIDDNDRALFLLRRLKNTSRFVYIADKNMNLLQQAGIPIENTCKISNGLPRRKPQVLQRSMLNIGEDDFVLCLASRALPSKGWAEAVEAVTMANTKSSRTIHLLLLGEGEMYEVFKNHPAHFIHTLGNQWGLENYYALSDMGFFPSRYPGESCPLVNIECLLTGTPIIASNIGDIKNQLTTDSGQIAGGLFDLEKGNIPVSRVAELILSFSNSKEKLQAAISCAWVKSTHFDITTVAQKYLDFYLRIIDGMEHKPKLIHPSVNSQTDFSS